MTNLAKKLFFAFLMLVVLNGALQAFAADKKKAAPEDFGPMKELKGELMITKSEEQAIGQLNKLLAKHKGNKEVEPGLWFRLAEMYMRRAKGARFFEMNRDSEAVVRFTPAAVKSTGSTRYVTQAIEAYDLIERKFPRFEALDMVLFNNGFARQQIGQTEQAKAVYLRLVKDHTYSEFVPDAYLALGEIHYDQHDFKNALVHFGKIKEFPQSRVYPYGLYKKAWTHYNLKDPRAGLEELENVASYSKRVRAEGGDPKLDLRKEALSDMVLFYSEVFEPSGALKYFAKQADSREIGPLLLKLGRLYRHHGRLTDFEGVHLAFVDKYPEAVERPLAHQDLIEYYDTQKKRPQAVAHLKLLAGVCADGGDWVNANGQAAPVADAESPIPRCGKIFASLSSGLATKWHNLWQKIKEEEIADSAEEAYRLYLTRDSGKTPVEVKLVAARKNYADLLFQRSKFRGASDQYESVAVKSLIPKEKEDNYYAALLSLEKAVNNKWDDKDEARFRVLVKAYTTGFPKAPFVREVLFTQAFIAYEKGRFDEAAPQFLHLADAANDAKAIKAQDLYLDILNIKKDWSRLKVSANKWSKTALAEDRRTKLTKLWRESWFSEVQQMETNKQSLEAAREYKKFALENQGSELGDKALWNAARLEFDLMRFADAAATAASLYKLFPKSDKVKEALTKSAQTYEFMGQLRPAAAVLEDLAKIDGANAEKWLNVAADFYALEGEVGKARRLYEPLARSKDQARAQMAFESMRVLETRSGDKNTARKLRDQISERGVQPAASLARLEIAQEAYDRKDNKEAFRVSSEILRMDKASRRALGGARYIQASVLEQEFANQSVKTSSPERVGAVLGVKTDRLDKTQKAYQDAIKYGDPEVIVKSLRRLASCYEQYAKAIRSIEFPGTANATDAQAVMNELEKIVAPMEDKVADTLNEALKLAKQFQLHDGSVAEIQKELDRVNMRSSAKADWKIEVPAVAVPVLPGGTS